MNFSTMEYFIALAEERSFTRAAERLMVTQQTLSAHIASVERELGVKLVNRTVPLTLTYAGQVLLTYARRFEADRRAMMQEFADIVGDRHGLLAIGIGSTRGHMLLPQAIASFRARRPGVDVHIVEGENDEIIEALRAGRIDMAVATLPRGMAGVEVRSLWREQLVMLVSKALLRNIYGTEGEARAEKASREHSMVPLAECPLLMLGRRDQEGELSHRLVERSGIDAHIAVMSENSETLIELAMQGVGACFVDWGIVRAMLDQTELEDMCIVDLGHDALIDVQVAWRSSGHVWSVIVDFAEQLARQVSGQERRS